MVRNYPREKNTRMNPQFIVARTTSCRFFLANIQSHPYSGQLIAG